MKLSDDLLNLNCGDIATDAQTLATASRDTSLFSVTPEVVVAPRSAEDIKKLVAYASSHAGVSLTARSGGTGMDGGALGESIIVDFTKYFTRIKGFTAHTGTVEPGVYYRDFERESLKRNLLMPSYPASREICTVGGMVANNAGGELTLTYGKTSAYVHKLSVVLSDGNEYTFSALTEDALHAKMLIPGLEGDLYRGMYKMLDDNAEVIAAHRPRVSKNSAGYALWDVYNRTTKTFDFTKLFTGAQGTLGLITNIEFGLISPHKHSHMVVVFLDDLSRLPEIIATTLACKPTTFESYDDKTLSLALRFFKSFLLKLGVRKTLSIALSNIPAGWSLLSKGLPKLVLQITFSGDDTESLYTQGRLLIEKLSQFSPRFIHATRSEAEIDEYWLIRRESFNLLRTKVKGKSTAPFIDDIVLPVATLNESLPKLYAILDEYKRFMVHNIAGHIGNGNFHIIPLMDLSKENVRAVIPEIMKRVYDLVLSYGGSTTGEHNDGIIRSPFLEQQFGEKMYALFKKTKELFDPKNIFNPGKKIGATMEYAIEHIAH